MAGLPSLAPIALRVAKPAWIGLPLVSPVDAPGRSGGLAFRRDNDLQNLLIRKR